MQAQEPKCQELEYLRNELNQRINFSDENMHKLLGHIMLVWGGTLAFFSAKEDFVKDEFLLFISATVFFISIIVLYFLSCLNFECVKGNSKIAAYVTVFYEKRPDNKKDDKRFWELALFEIEKKEINGQDVKRNKKSNTKRHGEYYWFSIIAIIVIIVIFIRCCYLSGVFNIDCICLEKTNVFMIGCFLYIAASLYLCFEVYKNTLLNSKDLLDLRKDHLKSFLGFAIETGHYTVKTIIDRFGEDFCRDIMGERLTNLSKGGSS